MADLTIPAGAEALTPEWLTQALRETGTITKSAVTSFDMEPDIAAGSGFLGQLARLTPHYDQAEEGAPQSIIAKLVTPVAQWREMADGFRFYEIETRFYEQIADEVELRTPRRYYSHFDSQSGEFILLLEDLVPARVGDQLAGCTVEEAGLCLNNLAKFHATWWESPRLAQMDWLPTTGDPLRAQTLSDNYQEAWPPFAAYVGDRLTPAMQEIGERFGASILTMSNRFDEPPHTICHGDYRLDNLFFATPEGGDPLAVIDWQISSRGRGVFDVAYFTCGTLPPNERKRSEMDLLRMYHRTLTENGVSGYDFDRCLEDYRASVLYCLAYSVLAIGNLDLSNERGVQLFNTIMDRTFAAITDLNAGELLPD